MKMIPSSARISPIRSGVRSMRTPSASRTSADPLRDVKDRFPCLARRTPSPAATSAAAVEMLKVVTPPPPVPAVSTSEDGSSAGTGTMASRRARTPPATSTGWTPLARSPTRKPAIWISEAAPVMKQRKTSCASSPVRSRPSATFSSRRVRSTSRSSGSVRATMSVSVGWEGLERLMAMRFFGQ